MQQKRRIDNYDKKTEIEHILTRPDMYVGSNTPTNSYEFIAEKNASNSYNITKKNINYPPGLLRIFVEALSNAIDNVQRSREENIKCTKIKVGISKETGETSVWNDGKVIPIEKTDDGDYIHSMIFGQLRTSSNYNDEEDRLTSGRFGFGIKLTNVFSTSFKVNGADPVVKKSIEQVWTNNMTEKSTPHLSSFKNVNGFTCVTYTPDFKQFGISGYTDDIISLYTKYIIDSAMLTKINVYLNDELIPVKTLSDYAKMYSNPSSGGDHLLIKTENSEVILQPHDNNEYQTFSWVNGVNTVDGGKHVDAWTEELFRPIVTKLNKPNKPQINIKDVKQFFQLFVICSIPNPIFESQNKKMLTSPTITAIVTPTQINKILKWDVIEKINQIISGKELNILKKAERTTRGASLPVIKDVDHANNASTKKSHDCSLILCEGLSAKTYAMAGLNVSIPNIKTGRDWLGIFPLRGKILNPRNASIKKISENETLTNLIKTLNLRIDTDYTKPENFKTLNYGRIIILVDADTDGFHIGGLIINFFHFLYPSLFLRDEPYIIHILTPIVKITGTKKTDDVIFYDERKFHEYFKANPSSSNRIKYYKGLGTSTKKEVLQTFGKKVVKFVRDEEVEMNMDKIFSKMCSDKRKEWLEQYDPDVFLNLPETEQTIEMNISDFLNNEVIKFSINDCGRSIPSLIDGLKESQRKILYACFKRNLTSEIKVSQLAGYVSEHTNYHHGEQNLASTIIGMASIFVGSNNISLLSRGGQFGTRLYGGKDAASPRYIFTKLDFLTRFIFHPDDDVLLERNVDDGDVVEPKFYVPIIPMVLVNGVCGAIGTGWSSSIPCYNPLDMCNTIKVWLEGNTLFEKSTTKISKIESIKPWYRDFTGMIERVAPQKFVSRGVMQRLDENTVLIKELPIGTWTENFKENLEEMVTNGNFKAINKQHNDKVVHFEVSEISGGIKCDEDTVKLHSTLSLTNMVLFNETGKIKKYELIDDIIEEFCVVRFRYYTLRRNNLIKIFTDSLKLATNKLRFVNDVMENKIRVFKVPEDKIITQLSENRYDQIDKSYEYLLRMQVRNFSYGKITELEDEVKHLQNKLKSTLETSETQMWINDLNVFVEKYNVWLKMVEDEEVDEDSVVVKKKVTKKK